MTTQWLVSMSRSHDHPIAEYEIAVAMFFNRADNFGPAQPSYPSQARLREMVDLSFAYPSHLSMLEQQVQYRKWDTALLAPSCRMQRHEVHGCAPLFPDLANLR